ncbi:hypothetical protein AAKU58_004369, partial [Oxalobacteraceae bacterium GrIS 1.18]
MSYKEMLKIVLVAIGLIFLISESIGQTNAQKVGSADRQQVSICGTIRQEVKWGPPNFGENPKEDTKWLCRNKVERTKNVARLRKIKKLNYKTVQLWT